jgi:UDP-N-acetylglucosamine 2-epimerase (non-hydrolysing)
MIGEGKKIKILSIFGTRPEAIKMAPVIRELESRPDVESRVVVTAQHREMLDQVVETFNIKPDYDLEVMRPGQDLFDVTGAVLKGLKGVLEVECPDLVLVQGDTTTTFTGALAAFYCQIPVGHIEAGLRTYQKYAPFPEEMNRVLTTRLADIHFAPTDRSRGALLKEGINPGNIFVTGNPVIDALYQALEQPFYLDPEISRAFRDNKRVILLTTHRRENLGAPLQDVYMALREVLFKHPDVAIIFPVHKNPAVRSEVKSVLHGVERVYLTEPLDYLPFINVMKRAYMVLTDSGGIQIKGLFQCLVKGIDHRVAGYENISWVNPLFQQSTPGPICRGEMNICQTGCENPVHLLRKGSIFLISPQARFYVSHRYLAVKGG